MTDLVLTEQHDGGVAVLRLNRPPMNPLSIVSCSAYSVTPPAGWRRTRRRRRWWSGSEKAFGAGADISELRDQAGVL